MQAVPQVFLYNQDTTPPPLFKTKINRNVSDHHNPEGHLKDLTAVGCATPLVFHLETMPW